MPDITDFQKQTVQDSLMMLNKLYDELKTAEGLVIPALREFLDELRGIRMSFGTEVRHILQSSRELSELTKQAPALREAAISLETLRVVLDDKNISLLRKLLTEDKS